MPLFSFLHASPSFLRNLKFFKLPSGVKEILTKARPGECILIRGGDVRAIKIDMTKFESEFITT